MANGAELARSSLGIETAIPDCRKSAGTSLGVPVGQAEGRGLDIVGYWINGIQVIDVWMHIVLNIMYIVR